MTTTKNPARRNDPTTGSQRASDGLRDAVDVRVARTRAKVTQALDDMEKRGLVITKAAVARQAGVSRDSLYAHPDLNQKIADAIDRQSEVPPTHPTPASRSDAAVRTALVEARQRVKALTAELDRYREDDRLATGALIEMHEEAIATKTLQDYAARINDLERDNAELRRASTLQSIRIASLEEDLAAALEALARSAAPSNVVPISGTPSSAR